MGYERTTKRRTLLGSAVMGDENVIRFKDVTIAHAAILTLRAAPVTLVAAPGAGKIALFHSALLVSSVPASVYTETADNLAIRQVDGSGALISEAIETTASILTSTGIKATTARPKVDQIGLLLNSALVLHNTGDGEFGGGAAANTLKVRIFYYVQKPNFGTLA